MLSLVRVFFFHPAKPAVEHTKGHVVSSEGQVPRAFSTGAVALFSLEQLPQLDAKKQHTSIDSCSQYLRVQKIIFHQREQQSLLYETDRAGCGLEDADSGYKC